MQNKQTYERHYRDRANLLCALAKMRQRSQRLTYRLFSLSRAFLVSCERELIVPVEGVGKLFGMPYVPFTPFFPLLGMLGTLPLPTKWFMHFGKPIRLAPVEGEARWQRARHEAIRVRRTIQTMVARLKRRRQSVFFG